MEPKKPSVREISRRRELDVLRVIGLCGYLTTRLIALGVWRKSTEHVARNKAQLMLVRMEKKGLVIKKSVASQSLEHVWILTKRGADELNTQSDGEPWASDGHDLGFTRLQRDKLALGRGFEKVKESHHASVLLGRAGIRTKLPKWYGDCDAVFVEVPDEEACIYTGLIAAVDARQSLVERVVTLKKRGLPLEFVGEEQTISVLLKRVEQAMI